ncbi:MAG: TraR/DksA family transcriptional regulator [Alphaproteobacteria bacterium]|nr:TraR/DksA family transcriptional regulator [Alphaproteobacteria bacterium]MDD9919762.1 TraR/DksA family transcriptional regulator [Alphaproteobacteria bacterium]
MVDPVDMAQAEEESHREASLRLSTQTPAPPSQATVCVECGATIHPKRKELLPETDICRECAQFNEQEEQRSAHLYL